MKALVKTKDKKENVKKKGVTKPKPKKEHVLFVAQEINFVRKLSSNDKKTRDRMLKVLKKWIGHSFQKGYDFKEVDFARVWKGLFYAVWMSDKPLIQEELCDNIAGVLDLFTPDQLKYALLMAKVGFKKLATEWYGIDQHRMDKFLMLVRRYLRGSLRCLERCDWSLTSCQKYGKMLSGPDGLFCANPPHYVRNATSMLLHFADCFLEELAKVSKGEISGESLVALLQPFLQYTCSGPVLTICTATRRMLTALLRQSDIGLEYAERTRAWKQMGCPAGGPDALEPASDDDEDDEQVTENGDGDHDSDDNADISEKALDPRAGRVDVELPVLPVPARLLAASLAAMLPATASKARRRLNVCLQRLEKLAEGEYPLPVSVPDSPPAVKLRPARAARSLRSLEHKLRADADDLKLRGLSRKLRKRLLRKSRAGVSIVEDVEGINKSLSNDSDNNDWLIEPTEEKPKKPTKDSSNKENQEKPNKHKTSPLSNAQKRKHDSRQNAEVSNKKQKVDKTKKIVANTDKKKNNLVENNKKLNAHEGTDKKKDKLVENSNKKNLVAKKDKKNKPNKSTEAAQNDVKSKVKNGKTEVTKDNKKIARIKPITISDIKESQKANKIENTKLDKGSDKTQNKVSKLTEKAQDKVPLSKLQKQISKMETPVKNQKIFSSPKKVKFQLKMNSMQKPTDYYNSVRKSPNIPFDGTKKPTKTNLKCSTPSPINPFFVKKLRMSK